MSETAPSNLSPEEEAFLAIEAAGIQTEAERFFADPTRKRDIEATRPLCKTQVSILSLEDLPRKLQEKGVSLDVATGLWWRERFKRWSDRGPQSNRDKQATWVARWFAREFLREAWKSELLAVTRGHWKQTELYGFSSAQESFKEADRWVKAHLGWSPSKDELENISGTLWWKAHRRYVEDGDIYEARQKNQLLDQTIKERDRTQGEFEAAHLATTKGPESERERAKIDADSKGKQLTALEARVRFAFHWPAVVEQFKRKQSAGLRISTALVQNKNGGLMRLYGRGENKFEADEDLTKPEAQRYSVRIKTPGAQLSLFVPHKQSYIGGPPSKAELVEFVSAAVEPRNWRVFMACMHMAQEDFDEGNVEARGDFLFTKKRLADKLGITSKDTKAALEGAIQGLMATGFEIETKVGGKPHRMEAAALIIDNQISYSRGRRPKNKEPKADAVKRDPIRVYRITPSIMDTPYRDGAPFFILEKEMLRPPDGVSQREWDSALKLLMGLFGYARLSRRRANKGAEFQFSSKTETLLTGANLTASTTRREKMRAIEGAIASINRSPFAVAKLSEDKARVLYSLLGESRERLESIKTNTPKRKALK